MPAKNCIIRGDMILLAVLLPVTLVSKSFAQLVTNESPIIHNKITEKQMLQLLLKTQESKKTFNSLQEFVNTTLEKLNERFVDQQRKPDFGVATGTYFQGCDEIYEAGFHASGVYQIWMVKGYQFLTVHCDMDTIGGTSKKRGWITIQRRMNGEVNFDRGWDDYVSGFGKPTREHWIGLQNIYSLTNERKVGEECILRIDIEDWDGRKGFMEYSAFEIMHAESDYALHSIGAFTGSEGLNNALRFSISGRFSTSDHNNDDLRTGNCVRMQTGGWWFGFCMDLNLNGRYPVNREYSTETMFIANWKRNGPSNSALRFVSMKVQ